MKRSGTWLAALCALFLMTFALSCGGEAASTLDAGTDFVLEVDAPRLTVPPGALARVALSMTWLGCPPRDVSLSVEGAPSGIEASFTSNPAPTASELLLQVDPSMAGGSYPLLLRGANGGLVHTRPLLLVVDAAAPGFTVQFAPPTLVLDARRPAVLNVNIQRSGGFADPVSLEAQVPPGMTYSVSPSPLQGVAPAESRAITFQGGGVAPGPYTVTVLAKAGHLEQRQSIPVTVLNLPDIRSFTVNPAAVDLGGSALLQADYDGGVGTVDPGVGPLASGGSVAVNPAASTTYTLTVSNALGTAATRSATLTVHAVSISLDRASATLTTGHSLTFTASVAGALNPAVTWSLLEAGGGSLANAGPSTTYTAPPTPGLYHLRATSVADPSRSATAAITVVAAPTAALSAATASVPYGAPATLTPTFSGGDPTLSPAVLGDLVSGVPVRSLPLTAPTTFTLTVTNPAGDTASASVRVSVDTVGLSLSPTARILSVGASTTLSATVTGASDPGVTWTLLEPGGGLLVPSASTAIYTAPATPGTYHVKATSVADPSKSDTFTATVVALPTAGLSASALTADVGARVTLVPTFSGGTPSLVPAADGALQSGVGVPTFPLSSTTTFTLTVTNAAGDSAVASATITVPGASVQITPASKTLTVGATTNLNASVTGAVDASVTWSLVEAGGGALVPSGSSATYTAPALPGTYHVRATSTADPSRSATFTATVVAAPTAALAASSPSVVYGGTAILTPTFTGGSASLDPALPGSLQSGVGISTPPLTTTTTFTLTVTNAAGDLTRASVTILVSAVTLSLAPSSKVLSTSKSQLLTATVSGAADPSVTWTLLEAGGGALVPSGGTALYTAPPLAGTYHVRATSVADPSKSATFTATVVDAPTAALTASASPVDYGTSVNLTPTFSGGSASLSPSLGALNSGVPLPSGPLTATTTFTLTVTNAAGDSAVASTTVVVNPVVVTLAVKAKSLAPGQSFPLSATVTGTPNTAVTWALLESGGGSLAPAGNTALYTAPALPGTYHTRATSVADPSKFDTFTATVSGAPSAVITGPRYATANTGGWAASVPVQAGCTYAWTIANGSISTAANGPAILFTAGPGGITTLGCTVTNDAGVSAVGSLDVTVVAPPSISSFTVVSSAVGIPASPLNNLYYGEPLTFSAVFTGDAGTVDHGVGPISSGSALSGPSILAQPSGSFSYTLTVTNLAGTRATASVPVTIQPVVVTLTPTAVRPIYYFTRALPKGIDHPPSGLFDVQVTGAYQDALGTFGPDPYTWTTTCPGSTFTSPSGYTVFTPGTNGAFTLTATSLSNPAVSASVSISVVALPTVSLVITQRGGNWAVDGTFAGGVQGTLYDNTSPLPQNLDGSGLPAPASPLVLATSFASPLSKNGEGPTTGPTLHEAYLLAARNAAGDYAFATASRITLTISQGATFAMPGKTATYPGQQTFTATASGSSAGVNWTIQETSNAGQFLDAVNGLYEAPTVPGTFHLKATSPSDPNQNATIAVTVVPVFVWPGNATVGNGGQVILRHSVLGANPAVTWSLQGGSLGSVNANGVYTGPVAVAGPLSGTATVITTLSANPAIQVPTDVRYDTTLASRGAFNAPTGTLTNDRTAHTLTLLGDGEVLMAGGDDPVTPSPTPLEAHLYKPALDSWLGVGVFPPNVMSIMRKYHTATLLSDGSVLLAGGYDAFGSSICDAERFIPTGPGSGYFRSCAGDQVTERAGHTATLLPNGKVLLAGGETAPGFFLDSLEIYDPLTDSFSPVSGTLSSPRTHHHMVRLHNGKVLVVGGSSDGTGTEGKILASADLYDPATNTVSPTTSLPYPVMDGVMELAANGNAVLAGGLANPSAGVLAVSAAFFQYAPAGPSWTASTQTLATGRRLPMGALLWDGTFMVLGGLGSSTADFYNPVTDSYAMGDQGFPINPATIPLVDGTTGRMVVLLSGQAFVAGTGTPTSGKFP